MRRPLTPDDPRHGSSNAYKNCGCRCDRCREANTAYGRERLGRLPRAERYALQRANQPHNANTYSRGRCRCEVCRKAASLRRRSARRRNQGMAPHPELWKYQEGA